VEHNIRATRTAGKEGGGGGGRARGPPSAAESNWQQSEHFNLLAPELFSLILAHPVYKM